MPGFLVVGWAFPHPGFRPSARSFLDRASTLLPGGTNAWEADLLLSRHGPFHRPQPALWRFRMALTSRLGIDGLQISRDRPARPVFLGIQTSAGTYSVLQMTVPSAYGTSVQVQRKEKWRMQRPSSQGTQAVLEEVSWHLSAPRVSVWVSC